MAAAATKRARDADGGSICGSDRLSALPDDLRRRVLSFLPAQQAVQTTVLSKRWADLWRSAPGINLDLMHFRRSPYEPWAETTGRMERFFSKLLVLHDSPCLDAFRLTASSAGLDSRRHIDAWVRRAVWGNPLVLEVRTMSSDGHDLYQLPHLGSSSLPWRRLKRLKLTGVSLDHSFAEMLRSWWPHLEDLVLVQCQIGFCGIESDRLRNLTIQYCTNPPADVFVIRASGLAALSLALHNSSYRNGVSLHVGNSLVRASVTLKRDEFSPRNEAMILGSLFNVASLEMKDFQAMVCMPSFLCCSSMHVYILCWR